MPSAAPLSRGATARAGTTRRAPSSRKGSPIDQTLSSGRPRSLGPILNSSTQIRFSVSVRVQVLSPIISLILDENSPSRLAADGVSNSFANKSVTAFAHYEVETNVPGGAIPPLTSLLLGRSAHDDNRSATPKQATGNYQVRLEILRHVQNLVRIKISGIIRQEI